MERARATPGACAQQVKIAESLAIWREDIDKKLNKEQTQGCVGEGGRGTELGVRLFQLGRMLVRTARTQAVRRTQRRGRSFGVLDILELLAGMLAPTMLAETLTADTRLRPQSLAPPLKDSMEQTEEERRKFGPCEARSKNTRKA